MKDKSFFLKKNWSLFYIKVQNFGTKKVYDTIYKLSLFQIEVKLIDSKLALSDCHTTSKA